MKVRWDTTVKYSAAIRTQDANPALVEPEVANLDDGDRNFKKNRLVSNRVDVFTEADAVYRERYGVRVSADGWYDAVYNRGNDNDFALTNNNLSVPSNQFTAATRNIMGRKTELLDAFVFGRSTWQDVEATLRAGRLAQVWGETLFFGSNGIAGGMAPVDYIKLFSVPGSTFKEVMLPVDQVTGQVQVNPHLSFSAYYQFQWEPNRIPGVGAYSSFADIFGVGAERLLWSTGSYFANGGNIQPKNSGQYGFQVRFRPAIIDADIGLYALRFHQKDPNLYIAPSAGPGFFANQGTPGQQVGTFRNVYGEGIRAYGASISSTVGSASVGVEASVREHAALVNPGVFIFDPTSNNSSNPAYPIGRTAHLNVSAVQLLSPTPLWQGGTALAEIGWNRRLSITRNPQSLDPNATRDALGLRGLLTPTYYQVWSGVDLSVPIGLGYNPRGRSSAVSLFNSGVDKGGDYSLGLSFKYQSKATFGLSYTGYFGAAGAVLAPTNDRLSFGQYYKDRGTLAASAQMSF